MTILTVEKITPGNVAAASRLAVEPHQKDFVAPGEGGPEEFYLKLGFRPTGQTFGGEVVGRIEL